eukprot:TRINITY_DN3723_c1_g1_i1.p1 TRINITY_DN3723_c1_g1~~TRINITY_DN3723_c1_g1_i1.p1  ORF type:complete len:353 (+),score=123.54 TRINITY_DN3723_c1_g1_i1:94-1152(+)
MVAEKHELVNAALRGAHDEVKSYLKKGMLQPTSNMCAQALFVAAQSGFEACVRELVNFGVAGHAEVDGTTALHVSCDIGCASVVKLLMAAKAESQSDKDGYSPMQMALKKKPPHLNAARELLRAGVKLGPHDEAIGLGNVVREVQLEKLTEELRARAAAITIDAEDIARIDSEAWTAQKEHMRLLELREYQKAGIVLVDIEKRLREESEAAREAETMEKELSSELVDQRVKFQTLTQDLVTIVKEYEDVKVAHAEMREETDRIASEFGDRRAELRAAQKEKIECDERRRGAEDQRDAAKLRNTELEGDLEKAQKARERLQSEVATARADLNEWMRDRERAAQLTAQAHKILG